MADEKTSGFNNLDLKKIEKQLGFDELQPRKSAHINIVEGGVTASFTVNQGDEWLDGTKHFANVDDFAKFLKEFIEA